MHSRSVQCHKRAGHVATQEGKLISKVEVPAFIPRADLCEQLMRWALGNAQDDGLANFGCGFAAETTMSTGRHAASYTTCCAIYWSCRLAWPLMRGIAAIPLPTSDDGGLLTLAPFQSAACRCG